MRKTRKKFLFFIFASWVSFMIRFFDYLNFIVCKNTEGRVGVMVFY